MKKRTVGLIYGGVSSEREVSLKSGEQVFQALDKSKYEVIRFDPKTDMTRLIAEAPGLDVAMIILHGPYGEDGTVQGMLDLLNVPYQGSGVLGSALAMNKLAAKKLYEKAGLPVPIYASLRRGDPINLDQIFEELDLPVVVKPVSCGSSIGMTIVRNMDSLRPAIETAFNYDRSILVEAYILGREMTCGVLGNEHLEALPPIEIIPTEGHEFFDYHAKYSPGASREICPAQIPKHLTEQVQHYAKAAHQALFCRGYSRTDMILVNDDLMVLETNTIPGMTATSLLPQEALAAGITFSALLDRLIDLAIEDFQEEKKSLAKAR